MHDSHFPTQFELDIQREEPTGESLLLNGDDNLSTGELYRYGAATSTGANAPTSWK